MEEDPARCRTGGQSTDRSRARQARRPAWRHETAPVISAAGSLSVSVRHTSTVPQSGLHRVAAAVILASSMRVRAMLPRRTMVILWFHYRIRRHRRLGHVLTARRRAV